MAELTPYLLRELAKKYAESIIEDWVFECLGEIAEEYGVSLDQMKKIADLAASAKVIIQ